MCPFSEFQGLRGVSPISSLKTDDSLWDASTSLCGWWIFTPKKNKKPRNSPLPQLPNFNFREITPDHEVSGRKHIFPLTRNWPRLRSTTVRRAFWGRVDKDKYGCASVFCLDCFFSMCVVFGFLFGCFHPVLENIQDEPLNQPKNLAVFLWSRCFCCCEECSPSGIACARLAPFFRWNSTAFSVKRNVFPEKNNEQKCGGRAKRNQNWSMWKQSQAKVKKHHSSTRDVTNFHLQRW